MTQPPNLDDLRAQRDTGRFGGGGANAGYSSGCGGCAVLASVLVALTGVVIWLL